MEDRDSRNHSVLHHACYHSSWSWRICYACEVIARDCHVDVINSCTTGYAIYYTPLMYVCDAAGKYANERCRIANVLIERLADVEVRDQLSKQTQLDLLVNGLGGAMASSGQLLSETSSKSLEIWIVM